MTDSARFARPRYDWWAKGGRSEVSQALTFFLAQEVEAAETFHEQRATILSPAYVFALSFSAVGSRQSVRRAMWCLFSRVVMAMLDAEQRSTVCLILVADRTPLP